MDKSLGGIERLKNRWQSAPPDPAGEARKAKGLAKLICRKRQGPLSQDWA
jgi:hypothetical protein